jgi:hypothetical protein
MEDALSAAPRRETAALRRVQVKQTVGSLADASTLGDSGHRERNVSVEGDKEFFLDSVASFGLTSSSQSLERKLVLPVQSGAKAFTAGIGRLAASSGSGGSLSVRLSLCKKRPLPNVEQGGRLTGQWDRATFMQSSRSVVRQAEAEWAAQKWWSLKFAAGRVHSMIRCDDELDRAEKNPADRSTFLDEGQAPTEAGKHCQHPGCTKQIQFKGKCIRHGGTRPCQHEGCSSIARWRGLCAQHGGRHTCSEANCEKLARSHGKCEEHGGGKTCSVPNCTSKVQKRGLCASHGGFTVCKSEGCERRAASKGLCSQHAVVVKCTVEGCEKTGQHRGFCYKHGVANGVIKKASKGKCKVEGCLKIQLRQGYCSRHAKERGITVGRICKVDGCPKVAQAGGCCGTHGGGTRCKMPGCNKSVVTKGLCSSHGGRKTCNFDGCEKWGLSAGDMKGFCVEHGGGYRCKHPGCNKSVQYKGLCCTHGGKLKCEAEGCNKTVRIKGFCPAHAKPNMEISEIK